jgi:hypothetical protein
LKDEEATIIFGKCQRQRPLRGLLCLEWYRLVCPTSVSGRT